MQLLLLVLCFRPDLQGRILEIGVAVFLFGPNVIAVAKNVQNQSTKIKQKSLGSTLCILRADYERVCVKIFGENRCNQSL